jgi:ribosomal-protein-alanine N-acetyltransferase
MLDISFTPFPTLSTERLLLRKIDDADIDQVFRLRSDKTSLEFLDKPVMQNKSEASLLINKITNDAATNQGITWGIALKENPGLLIGTIGLWRIIKEHYRAEIGYMLLPEYFRKGYMKEAIISVNTFGFEEMKLHSIEANINPANAGSAAVLRSTGYTREAYFRENFYFNGMFKDSEIYSLINSGENKEVSKL